MSEDVDEFLGAVAADLCDVDDCVVPAVEETSTGRALCGLHAEERELLAAGVCLMCREEDAADGSRYCTACDAVVEEGPA